MNNIAVNISDITLSFPKNLIINFEKYVPDTFQNSIKGYLLFHFEKSLEDIIAENSIETLQEIIIAAAKEEIIMCGGKVEG